MEEVTPEVIDEESNLVPAFPAPREHPPAELGAPVGFLTQQWVDQLEEQVELFKRAKLALLKITDDSDWCDQGGKPYLMDSGIKKVAGVAGVAFGPFKIKETSGVDKQGKWVRFACQCTATFRGKTHYQMGISTSRDKFFSKDEGKALPFEEIDLSSIEKKCLTNAHHRLLEDLLGLGGLTWEMLKTVGINRGKGGTARYKSSGRAWSPDKERLWNMFLEIHQGDKEGAKMNLFERTRDEAKGFKGVDDPARLSEKQVAWLLRQIEPAWRKATATPDEEGSDAVSPPKQAPAQPAAAAPGGTKQGDLRY